MFNFDGDILGKLTAEKLSKIHAVDLNEFKKEVQKRYEKAWRSSWDLRYRTKQPGRMNIKESVEYTGYLSTMHDCEWIASKLGFELKIPETTEMDLMRVIINSIKEVRDDYAEALTYYRNNKDHITYMISPSYKIEHERKIANLEGALEAYNHILATLNTFITHGE